MSKAGVIAADQAGGLGAWLAALCHDRPWLYALLVLGVMVGVGVVLGLLSDWLIALLGIDLGRLDRED